MIRYKTFTNTGSRDINEDYLSVAEKSGKYCFAVADGLGGHEKGEVASKIACETFKEIFLEKDLDNEEFFETAISEVHNRMLNGQKDSTLKSDMKTTLVSLVIDDEYVQWIHVGDSRLYLFKKNKIYEQTVDHSIVQMLVLAGDIKEKQIRNHPNRNKLLKVIGAGDDENSYDTSKKIWVEDCQAFLICTDGFWENITEKRMCKYLKKSKSPDEWLDKMCKEVAKNGKNKNMDNNTAIAIFME